jgi:hypothetical protein
MPPATASRSPPWLSSRPASTRPTTSSGPAAGGSRGARGVRPGRAQDALQVFARRSPGECRHAALRPSSARATTTPHRPALHGREPLHLPDGNHDDIANLFNALTGFGRSPEFQQLLVAPFNLHAGSTNSSCARPQAAEAGKPARIIAQDELAGRQGDDRQSLRRLARRESPST